MRHFHLTKNQYWRPVINVDKLWSLVPEEEKEGLTETSEVVPVIDTLRHGYGKVLGNGKYVPRGHSRFLDRSLLLHLQAAQTAIHCQGPIRLSKGRVSSDRQARLPRGGTDHQSHHFDRRKIKEVGGVVKLVA